MRSYLPASTLFDDGSEVEGIAWSPLRSRFVATALAGDPTGYLGNVGAQTYCYSSDGITWTGGFSPNVPNAPGEVADVYWSDGYTRYFTADSWDPSFWGVQPDQQSNSLQGQNTWSKLAKGTTATRSTAICVVEPAVTGQGNVIVGAALDSGTGRLIGKTTASSTGPWTAISTPIDNQLVKVTQIACHPTTGLLVATFIPLGVVSVSERIMKSSDGGLTWSLVSAGGLIDGDGAWGVCWNAIRNEWLITGDQAFVTATSTLGAFTNHNMIGTETSGKPCAAGAVTIIPGGNGDVTEWNGITTATQNLDSPPNGLHLNVASYSPALDRVVLGGLVGFAAIYYSVAAPAAVVPSLDVMFDLG